MRTYECLTYAFNELGKEKALGREIAEVLKNKMTKNSVNSNLCRAVKDGFLGRDERGFYYVKDSEEIINR